MQNNISKALLRKKFSTIDSPIKPDWIKVKIQVDKINEIKKTLKSNKIVTVCEEAMCPNMSDCWAKSHATFMILGDICTRACSFCNISTGKPNHVDHMEPIRVANSVKKLKKLAKEKNALVVTGHDPHAWEDFKKAPMFYYD